MFKKIFKRPEPKPMTSGGTAMFSSLIARIPLAWLRPGYVAVMAISMVFGGLIAVVAMSATGATAQPAAEAKSTDPATLQLLEDLDRRLSLSETQIALSNLDYTWEYDNQKVLSCVDHIDPGPADFGPDRHSWRAQIRKAGGQETLASFIPSGDRVSALGRKATDAEVTVELDVGSKYEMRYQQRPPGHRWDEAWTSWESCGVLLPRYPETPGQATWLQER